MPDDVRRVQAAEGEVELLRLQGRITAEAIGRGGLGDASAGSASPNSPPHPHRSPRRRRDSLPRCRSDRLGNGRRDGMVTLTGVAAGLGVVLVMFAYLKLARQPLVERGVLTQADHQAEQRLSLWAALSPWLLLVAFARTGQRPLPALLPADLYHLGDASRHHPHSPDA